MNTKKAIALLLVLVTALVVCVACANNNGEHGAVTYRIKNNTLANFAIVILREKNDKPQTWTITNMIPLICSYGQVNDLLLPFRHLRGGRGLGSLFCLKGTDEPSSVDPVGGNLTEFQLVWGDTYE